MKLGDVMWKLSFVNICRLYRGIFDFVLEIALFARHGEETKNT